MENSDLNENDVKKIKELINKMFEMKKATKNWEERTKIKIMQLQLERLVRDFYNRPADSEEVRIFKNLTAQLENAIKEKKLLIEKRIIRNIITEMKLLVPKVPLSMVNHVSSLIINYTITKENLHRKRHSSKVLWRIEEKMQEKDLNSRKITKLVKDLIRSEKYYGCKNNQVELQRIEVLKSRLSNILTQAYIIEESEKIIMKEVRNLNLINLQKFKKIFSEFEGV